MTNATRIMDCPRLDDAAWPRGGIIACLCWKRSSHRFKTWIQVLYSRPGRMAQPAAVGGATHSQAEPLSDACAHDRIGAELVQAGCWGLEQVLEVVKPVIPRIAICGATHWALA